jgi:cobalamin biosynthesis protein CobT
MKQEKIRETIKQLVSGNLRWCDPEDKLCLDRAKDNPQLRGFTHQSAEEVLDDIIADLKSLQDELNITASFNSAQL